MVTGILDGLRWLGLTWDEGPDAGGPHAPYFQSQRLDRYRAAGERLVGDGQAYHCYCSPERLARRARARRSARRGLAIRPHLPDASGRAARELEAAGAPRAVRFKVPPAPPRSTMRCMGGLSSTRANIEDFVILRSDGHPTYHLSVVVDDVEMQITHVIRGDDHISNTPKHVLLFEALGAPVPALRARAADPRRRQEAPEQAAWRNVGDGVPAAGISARRDGQLPGAARMVAWRRSRADDARRADGSFTLDGISGGNAVFNTEKLDWMNGQYIARLPVESWPRRAAALDEAGLAGHPARRDTARFHRLLELLRPRVKRLSDFVEQARPLLAGYRRVRTRGNGEKFFLGDMAGHLAALVHALGDRRPSMSHMWNPRCAETAVERGIKAGALIQAVRVALTGRTASPGLFEMMALLGREETSRVLNALTFLAVRRSYRTNCADAR